MQAKRAEQTAIEKAYAVIDAQDCICVEVARWFGTGVPGADELECKTFLTHGRICHWDAHTHQSIILFKKHR